MPWRWRLPEEQEMNLLSIIQTVDLNIVRMIMLSLLKSGNIDISMTQKAVVTQETMRLLKE